MGLSPSRFIIKKKVHKERFRPISLPPSGHALDWAEFLKGAELFFGSVRNAPERSHTELRFFVVDLGKKGY